MMTRSMILMLLLTASMWACTPSTSQESAEDAAEEMYLEEESAVEAPQTPEVTTDSSEQQAVDEPIIDEN